MKIQLRQIGILNFLTFVLFGVFITSSVFALALKIAGKNGIWLAIVLILVGSITGLIKLKHQKLRLITWSILGTLILCSILFIGALAYVETLLEGF